MAFWNVDLTTEDGAEGAAQLGAAACFIAAVLCVLGIVLMSGMLASTGAKADAIAQAVGGLVEMAVFVIAGFRLRARKGLIWGSVAALLLVAEMVMKIVTLTGLPGLVINAVLLVGIVNGVRGARALGGNRLSVDEVGQVFE